MPRLDVYVTEHCFGSPQARRLAQAAAERFPTVAVRVVDLEHAPQARADGLVAVPTYMLDGRIVALGNPRRGELFRRLEDALAGEPIVEASACPS